MIKGKKKWWQKDKKWWHPCHTLQERKKEKIMAAMMSSFSFQIMRKNSMVFTIILFTIKQEKTRRWCEPQITIQQDVKE